jgi:hypothetical protein
VKPHRLKNGIEVFVKEASNELVRMDGLDLELAEDRCREIAQVECDDEV